MNFNIRKSAPAQTVVHLYGDAFIGFIGVRVHPPRYERMHLMAS